MEQSKIWEHFQNEGSASFAGAKPRLRYLARLLRPDDRVLDVGVGDGAFEEIAAERGLVVHVLDPDARAIERVAGRLGLGDRAKAGSIVSIPWPDASFDSVVVSEVLEHLDDATLEAGLAEIRRVLRPGGVLLGTVPADENLEAETAVCPDCGRRFHRWGHARSFSATGLAASLSARFVEVSVERRWFPSWPSLNWKGKSVAASRAVLARFGVWGAGHNFVFRARRPGEP